MNRVYSIAITSSGNTVNPEGFITTDADASEAMTSEPVVFATMCQQISVVNDTSQDLFIAFRLGNSDRGFQMVKAGSMWGGDRPFTSILLTTSAGITTGEAFYITGMGA